MTVATFRPRVQQRNVMPASAFRVWQVGILLMMSIGVKIDPTMQTINAANLNVSRSQLAVFESKVVLRPLVRLESTGSTLVSKRSPLILITHNAQSVARSDSQVTRPT